jgi:hypothetical protein
VHHRAARHSLVSFLFSNCVAAVFRVCTSALMACFGFKAQLKPASLNIVRECCRHACEEGCAKSNGQHQGEGVKRLAMEAVTFSVTQ